MNVKGRFVRGLSAIVFGLAPGQAQTPGLINAQGLASSSTTPMASSPATPQWWQLDMTEGCVANPSIFDDSRDFASEAIGHRYFRSRWVSPTYKFNGGPCGEDMFHTDFPVAVVKATNITARFGRINLNVDVDFWNTDERPDYVYVQLWSHKFNHTTGHSEWKLVLDTIKLLEAWDERFSTANLYWGDRWQTIAHRAVPTDGGDQYIVLVSFRSTDYRARFAGFTFNVSLDAYLGQG